MDRASCEAHFRPKARGLVVLDRLLGEEARDGFFLFSSMSAVLGGLGLSAYAAANAFLDAYAHQRSRTAATPWTVVNWDTWDTRPNPHGGFGATLRGYVMSRTEALEAFDRVHALQGACVQVINSTGDLKARLDQWVRGIAFPRDTTAGPATHPRPPLSTEHVEPAGDTERAVAAIWERILGVQVGARDNFLELGGNSLIGTQLIGRLRQAFGVMLPLSLLFDAPTVSSMALAVEAALLDEIDGMDESEALRLSGSENGRRALP